MTFRVASSISSLREVSDDPLEQYEPCEPKPLVPELEDRDDDTIAMSVWDAVNRCWVDDV